MLDEITEEKEAKRKKAKGKKTDSSTAGTAAATQPKSDLEKIFDEIVGEAKKGTFLRGRLFWL